jgi:5-methyltetrahydropteroyltriglutamate--homocysteine methyltransferase
MAKLPLLPTSVIGSYPRPKWLKETIRLYRAGKVNEEDLQEAFNDAVVAVINDHYKAGVDVPTDGEVRRDEMVEFFAERIKGFKFYGPVRVWGTAYYRKPSVVSKIEYNKPLLVDEFKFASSVSYTENLKITITGPYTIAEWSYNEYYKNKRDLVFDLAKVINQEIRNLVEAGAKIIQIDEPALHTRKEDVKWAIDAINETVKGINAKLIMHICYGDYSLVAPYLNEIKVDQINFVETPEEVAKDIKRVLEYFTPEKVWINPDCGLKLLSRKIAFQKLLAMVEGTRKVREELKSKGYRVE